MGSAKKMRLNQDQIERMVLSYIKSNHPKFKLQDAFLETTVKGDSIASWWISCEHADGNESIMEDEQILLLIQQEKGWKKVTKHQVTDSEQEGFILELQGE